MKPTNEMPNGALTKKAVATKMDAVECFHIPKAFALISFNFIPLVMDHREADLMVGWTVILYLATANEYCASQSKEQQSRMGKWKLEKTMFVCRRAIATMMKHIITTPYCSLAGQNVISTETAKWT